MRMGMKPRFSCDAPGCEKTFTSKKSLVEHNRTHTGERPYECSICFATFSQLSSMQKHKKGIHDQSQPYLCDQCGRAFSQISNLIRHKRIHSGEKPYECKECGKKFISGSNLS